MLFQNITTAAMGGTFCFSFSSTSKWYWYSQIIFCNQLARDFRRYHRIKSCYNGNRGSASAGVNSFKTVGKLETNILPQCPGVVSETGTPSQCVLAAVACDCPRAILLEYMHLCPHTMIAITLEAPLTFSEVVFSSLIIHWECNFTPTTGCLKCFPCLVKTSS